MQLSAYTTGKLGMLFIAQKQGCVLKDDRTQAMASATSLPLLCKSRDEVLIFRKKLLTAG